MFDAQEKEKIPTCDLYRNNGGNNDRIFIARSSSTIAEKDIRSKGRVLAHSHRNSRPFLIPSCRVLNSLLLLPPLFAHISRFSNYARVAYLTDEIYQPLLLLCSFLRNPPPPSCSSCPFQAIKRDRCVQKPLCLCSRAMAIKRRPITIMSVVIAVIISKRALRIPQTSATAADRLPSVDRCDDRFLRIIIFSFFQSW